MSRKARRFPTALGCASLEMAECCGVVPDGDLDVAARTLDPGVPAQRSLARASRTRPTRHRQLAALRPIEGVLAWRDAERATATKG